MSASKLSYVPLGDLIELCDERNDNNAFSLEDVRGISNLKDLIFTKADMQGVSLTPYKLLKPHEFSYVTVTSRNGGKISLAMNQTDKNFIVSSSYINFRCKDTSVLLPEFLYIIFNRSEFDRYCRFNSWGSARETFDWSELCRVEIPLPSIEVQQELVDTYNGLKALAEQNEALIPRLSEACRAYIVDCKAKYPAVAIGDYISVDEEINSTNLELPIMGINIKKEFMPTNANTEGLDKSKYKILRKDKFVFSGMQTGRDVAIRVGMYHATCPVLISPAYTIFSVKPIVKNLLPEFLDMQFKRSESDRLGWFYSDSSIRSNLDWNRFCEFSIPLPPIEVQQAIVDVYLCLERAKKIASEARERLKTLCPALVQRAANS